MDMEHHISDRVDALTPSQTLAVSAKAKQLRAEGKDVIGLGAGEPDFDTPEHIKAAAVQALADGFTRYTPSGGIPELREAIAEKFYRDNRLRYSAKQIVVSCGGKHSCYNAVQALCNAGDEVIVPSPYWVSYPEIVSLASARTVILPTTIETDFKVTPEQLDKAINDRTRLLILNSPSNPTGTVYTPGEIRALADICVERDVYILSDDIYERILYDEARHCSPAVFSEKHYQRTVIVHGFAKAWSMTGWRLGFMAAPEPVAKAVDALQSHCTSNPTSFAQKGGLAALSGSMAHLDEWLKQFDRRRLSALERLRKMKGIRCNKPQGAFYLFPNISGTGLSSGEFCNRLLEEHLVAAVPGSAFGAEDYIRLSYATDLESLESGLDRMADFLRDLNGNDPVPEP